jgi:hypothetical protein
MDFFKTLVAEGSGNDDRNFIKFSNRTTTIQGRNILEFAKRQIHTADFVLERLNRQGGIAAVIDEMRKIKENAEKDPDKNLEKLNRFNMDFRNLGANPDDIKILLEKKSLNKKDQDRLNSYALNYYLSVSDKSADNRLVKFGEVKNDRDFIYMTGEIGDYNPLRTHLDRMNKDIRDIVTKGGKENYVLERDEKGKLSDLHFINTAVPKAATEKAVNMRVAYVGDHGHIYRSINELVDSYRNVKDPAVRAALREMDGAVAEGARLLFDKIASSGKATKEEIAIAAFKYGQKSGDYSRLFDSDNVRFGSFAEVEEQRKARLRSTEGLAAWEVPLARIIQAKEKTIDAFVGMHENVVYRNALRIGNQDMFGIENQENRIMKESFAVLDEYKALNTMLARMEQGNYKFALVDRFSSNKDAEEYVRGRMKELRNSYDAFEWFMTRDVHPLYGGSYPHMREGLISASFNAGLSTLRPQWIDQMVEAYGTPNYDNYPVLGGPMKWMSRYLINLNVKLQEPFVLMMRAEDKMTKGIPNPYELRYEYNNDVGRNLSELGVDRALNIDKRIGTPNFEISSLGRRFAEPGSIRGPSDQLMPSEKMDIPYTLSSFVSNLAKVPLFPVSTFFSLTETMNAYKKTYKGGDESAIAKPILSFAEKGRGFLNSVMPMEGSAVADAEEKWIAKRPPSHFGWHSGEFGTPGDLPGREHLFWGSGKRQIEPGQMWKLYNLHGLDTDADTRSLQDTEGLDYASLSIRKRSSTVVDDYFKREQEATWFSPSKHPVGIMSNPLFFYNWVSSKAEKIPVAAAEFVEETREKAKEGKVTYASAAKGAAAKTADFLLSPISNSLNLVAVAAGGTNYLLKCSACGSYVRRDAPNCPICRHQFEAKP